MIHIDLQVLYFYLHIVFTNAFSSSHLVSAKDKRKGRTTYSSIMRFLRLYLLLSLQSVFVVLAQKGTNPDETQPKEPIPLPPDYHAPADENSQDNSPKANAPGALAVGKDQYIAPADEETDIAEILEKLKDLVEKILDLVDNGVSTSTVTTPYSHRPIPYICLTMRRSRKLLRSLLLLLREFHYPSRHAASRLSV